MQHCSQMLLDGKLAAPRSKSPQQHSALPASYLGHDLPWPLRLISHNVEAHKNIAITQVAVSWQQLPRERTRHTAHLRRRPAESVLSPQYPRDSRVQLPLYWPALPAEFVASLWCSASTPSTSRWYAAARHTTLAATQCEASVKTAYEVSALLQNQLNSLLCQLRLKIQYRRQHPWSSCLPSALPAGVPAELTLPGACNHISLIWCTKT